MTFESFKADVENGVAVKAATVELKRAVSLFHRGLVEMDRVLELKAALAQLA